MGKVLTGTYRNTPKGNRWMAEVRCDLCALGHNSRHTSHHTYLPTQMVEQFLLSIAFSFDGSCGYTSSSNMMRPLPLLPLQANNTKLKYLSHAVVNYNCKMYILRLQRMLNEAQGKYVNDDKVRAYTASIRCQKDIESLSKIGLNPQEISRSLDLSSTSFVKGRIARIDQDNAERRRFLATGHIPEELETSAGVFHILQK
jgi:hypothetical protein